MTRAWVFVIAGGLGTAASLGLLLSLGDAAPACDINPVVTCAATVDNVLNTAIGLIAFPVVATLGVLMLSGVEPLPKLVWRGLRAGVIAGAVFTHVLIFLSLYDLRALCPYCMIIWICVVAIACHTFLPRFPWRALTVWLLAVIALAAQAFWTQWWLLLS
ncbi:vitamin K epoxide reductase family protein [Allorhizocola rhizosphaerae]|uniref:vitamin K epoxide reductase family protein n=1 Tax=Allorhizocola rhizosphaerae TaxID=1872709 RepID=UPI000E3B8105|nr:vitamin K epoxide reductase family protein [Allorhizocola rhizosphaerae]